MKIKTQSFTKQTGFSLVELMIVVAIIGVLASIAVPTFQGFILKSRQAEAKGNLSVMYSAQKAYYAQFRHYNPNLLEAGYKGEGNFMHNAGFAETTLSSTPMDFQGDPEDNNHLGEMADVTLIGSPPIPGGSVTGTTLEIFRLEAKATFSNGRNDFWFMTNTDKTPIAF